MSFEQHFPRPVVVSLAQHQRMAEYVADCGANLRRPLVGYLKVHTVEALNVIRQNPQFVVVLDFEDLVVLGWAYSSAENFAAQLLVDVDIECEFVHRELALHWRVVEKLGTQFE